MPLHLYYGIEIPDDELSFTASRSGGPGGQHVNKTSSRVTVRFDVVHSPSLPAAARVRLLAALGHRIAADGTVRVVSQSSRSQLANRKAATARLELLLSQALEPEVPRVETRVPRAEKKRRLESKKRRGETKRARRVPPTD